jgi:glucose-6-phosphate dehydrogenase assembly protein OpcA
MAQPVDTLNSWSATDVRLRDVLSALGSLRHATPLSSTRTSVLTLVVVATRRGPSERAVTALHELGGRHPARSIVVLPHSGSEESGIDAEVRLMGSRTDGRSVWFEDLELTVRGPAAEHLDSLIEPFTLPDLPVVCWYVDGLPRPEDPLVGSADVIMVDARELGEVECFATVESLCRHRPVVDLSWVRLQPWRELLARLFDGHEFRPFVAGVREARVLGKTGPRHLLGGWLADRLGLAPSQIDLKEHEHAGLCLHARHDGRKGVFEVARRGDERVVVASARIEGGPSFETPLVLPEATPAWGLAEALS